jgi:hypothetical protein
VLDGRLRSITWCMDREARGEVEVRFEVEVEEPA